MTDTSAAATTNPPPTGNQPEPDLIDRFLAVFKKKPTQPKPPSQMSPEELLKAGDLENYRRNLPAGIWSAADIRAFESDLLTTKKGRKALKKNPEFAGFILSRADAADIDDDLLASFGSARDDILAGALISLTDIKMSEVHSNDDPYKVYFDSDLFDALAKRVPKDVWNDEGLGLGQAKRGLGPTVLAGLFDFGSIDQILALLDKGVRTDLAAQTTKRGGSTVHSNFVMPLEHIVQRDLHDTAKLGTAEANGWPGRKRARVEKSKAILDKMAEKETAQAVTSWKEVEDSDLVAAFKANPSKPGTIWGFEYIREPYVEAAHETDVGKRPLRMLELWGAVKPMLDPKTYEDFLAKPDDYIDDLLKEAVDQASNAIEKVNAEPDKRHDATIEKFRPFRNDKKKFLKNFETDARKFLERFSEAMPAGSVTRAPLDDPGTSISQMGGVDPGKLLGAIACKAGLYNARDEGAPVYYCLDGINMDEATDYKKVKYKAIEEYLASGDQSDSFSEVITFKEVREILRNWDTLRFKNGDPVVQFVRKGRIMSKTAAEEFVKGYQQRMADANKEAGRRPAPGRVEKADPNDPNKTIRVLAFEKELAAIDPGLPAKLDAKLAAGADEAEIDKDARDIVRKAGYLQRVSKTNPEFTLKYIMSKCQVLIDYDLIANGLVDAAADFAKRAYAHPPADKDALKAPANTLKAEVKKCGVAFRVPLAESLIKHHNMKHSKRLKNIVKDG